MYRLGCEEGQALWRPGHVVRRRGTQRTAAHGAVPSTPWGRCNVHGRGFNTHHLGNSVHRSVCPFFRCIGLSIHHQSLSLLQCCLAPGSNYSRLAIACLTPTVLLLPSRYNTAANAGYGEWLGLLRDRQCLLCCGGIAEDVADADSQLTGLGALASFLPVAMDFHNVFLGATSMRHVHQPATVATRTIFGYDVRC